jgi:hypothetical protein
MIGTYIIYNSILFLPLVILFFERKIKVPAGLPYLLLTIFGIIRYDIGFDYDGMVKIFKIYSKSTEFTIFSKEPTFFLLCKLFSFSDKGYIFVFAIFFIANLFVLHKILDYYKIESEGLFVFITMCFLFDSFALVRQSLAILIFLYSLRFIESKNLLKYFVTVLIASVFHYSAIILLPFYWLLRIRMTKTTYFIIVIIAVILFYIGYWVNIRYGLFKLIPIYGDLYLRRGQYLLSVETNSGIGVLFTLVMLFLPILLIKDLTSNRVVVNTTFFGMLFYTLANGNLLLERFSLYFTFVGIIAISKLLKTTTANKYLLGAVLFAWFQASIYINRSGCNPYQTIFSQEARHEVFRANTVVKLK